jgi:hypothetical protein
MRILLLEERSKPLNTSAKDLWKMDSRGCHAVRFGWIQSAASDRVRLARLRRAAGMGRPSEIRWGSQQPPVLFLTDRNSAPLRDLVSRGNYLIKPFAFSDFWPAFTDCFVGGPTAPQ